MSSRLKPVGHHAKAAPEDVVKSFYTHLLGTGPTSACPDLFDGVDVFLTALPDQERASLRGDDATTKLWNYLRAHRRAYEFQSVRNPRDVRSLRLRYLVRSLDGAALTAKGGLAIVAMHPLSLGGREGVMKEVKFPLVPRPGSRESYLIDITGVTINGIFTDPERKFDHSKNLYELLGVR